jgi:DNA-binding CsgD family transcriptional regulator
MVARRFQNTDDEKRLIELYVSGLSQWRLAEEFDTTPVTVRSALRRAGLKIRGPGGPRRFFSTEEISVIADLFQAGKSQGQIAQHLSTTQSKVSETLRRQGLYSQRGARNGQHHPLWRGGRIILKGGYVMVKAEQDDTLAVSTANGGFYVMEHRLVMARHLGRPLTRKESVHHINGDRGDNRLENLQLRQGNHGNGAVYTCLDCGSHNVATKKLADITFT